MDDKTVQRKLNQLAKICDELHGEAQARYGRTGNLFFESEGSFHLMAGDCDGSGRERQEYVTFTSKLCSLGAGAW